MSSAVETTRGRPNSENGGSSGWMASRTPFSGGDRHHFLQELNEVGAHVAGGDIVETGNLGADFFARVAVFAAGQTGDDVPFERQDFIVAFLRQPLPCGLDDIGRVTVFSGAAFQHENIIGDEIDHVEAQRKAAGLGWVQQIGAGSNRPPA